MQYEKKNKRDILQNEDDNTKQKTKNKLKKNTAQKTKKTNKMDLIKYQKGETMVLASNLYFDRSPLRVVETKSMT